MLYKFSHMKFGTISYPRDINLLVSLSQASKKYCKLTNNQSDKVSVAAYMVNDLLYEQICDRICEKRSSTHIQFTNFDDS